MADEIHHDYLIEPIDPLVFGDGRTIGTVGVSRSRVLPPPSQLAGAVRSQAGSDPRGRWMPERRAEVLQLEIRGPLGALLDPRGEVIDWWLPRPADAVVMEPRPDAPRVRRLVPLVLPEGCAWDLDAGPGVGMRGHDPRKPDASALPFWSWRRGLCPWLEGRAPGDGFGLEGPSPELRTHVALERNGTARDGMLYGVTGVRYDTAVKGGAHRSWGGGQRQHRRHALAFSSDADLSESLIRPLGGERRLARWRRAELPWPGPPEAVLDSATAGALRMYLATPGAFGQGSRPRLDGAEVVAQANGRPEIVSGWDYQQRAPKPTRRLVPAGAVYFLRLTATDPQERLAWVASRWLRSVSDEPQAQRDGFGLALFGTWSGELEPLDLSPGGTP